MVRVNLADGSLAGAVEYLAGFLAEFKFVAFDLGKATCLARG